MCGKPFNSNRSSGVQRTNDDAAEAKWCVNRKEMIYEVVGAMELCACIIPILILLIARALHLISCDLQQVVRKLWLFRR